MIQFLIFILFSFGQLHLGEYRATYYGPYFNSSHMMASAVRYDDNANHVAVSQNTLARIRSITDNPVPPGDPDGIFYVKKCWDCDWEKWGMKVRLVRYNGEYIDVRVMDTGTDAVGVDLPDRLFERFIGNKDIGVEHINVIVGGKLNGR